MYEALTSHKAIRRSWTPAIPVQRRGSQVVLRVYRHALLQQQVHHAGTPLACLHVPRRLPRVWRNKVIGGCLAQRWGMPSRAPYVSCDVCRTRGSKCCCAFYLPHCKNRLLLNQAASSHTVQHPESCINQKKGQHTVLSQAECCFIVVT